MQSFNIDVLTMQKHVKSGLKFKILFFYTLDITLDLKLFCKLTKVSNILFIR